MFEVSQCIFRCLDGFAPYFSYIIYFSVPDTRHSYKFVWNSLHYSFGGGSGIMNHES